MVRKGYGERTVPGMSEKGVSILSSMKETSEQFFDACETGKGWEGTSQYCHADATFSAQAGALQGIETLQAYTDWMKGLLVPIPDGAYEVRSFAVDEERNNVSAYAVFRGTHTAEGGPVPPTGKRTQKPVLRPVAGSVLRTVASSGSLGEPLH